MICDLSRLLSLQKSHISPSLKKPHFSHLLKLFNARIALPKSSLTSGGNFKSAKTYLCAVLLPTPGSFSNNVEAFSNLSGKIHLTYY